MSAQTDLSTFITMLHIKIRVSHTVQNKSSPCVHTDAHCEILPSFIGTKATDLTRGH